MTKYDAIERIKEMAKRPEMWAFCYESFLMQLGLLLEVGGLDRDTTHGWISKQGAKEINRLLEQIPPDKAKSLCMAALQALEPKDN